jgi:hypothetical protein
MQRILPLRPARWSAKFKGKNMAYKALDDVTGVGKSIRVATGKRQNDRISRAIEAELNKNAHSESDGGPICEQEIKQNVKGESRCRPRNPDATLTIRRGPNGVQSAHERLEQPKGSANHCGTFPAMNRRIFHVLIALVLVACVVSPFVESALNCNDNVFSTGSDSESTLAIVVLLLELVLSLASLLVFLLPNFQLEDRVRTESRRPTSVFGFCINISDFSFSVPLRI